MALHCREETSLHFLETHSHDTSVSTLKILYEERLLRAKPGLELGEMNKQAPLDLTVPIPRVEEIVKGKGSDIEVLVLIEAEVAVPGLEVQGREEILHGGHSQVKRKDFGFRRVGGSRELRYKFCFVYLVTQSRQPPVQTNNGYYSVAVNYKPRLIILRIQSAVSGNPASMGIHNMKA
ncbi:uncharacterized protein CIMG_13132 [Coccidioides immitis RS]|uniref:Uncharacterized protein n=1 Tax=Coccidioides immitis (strain RS) TaxID=246410 RepID=A0A0D8JWN7_COCIM|nr:uncharacterized protein CIMG_13132 [Coccidioides immitis RS]KJF60688.1 hypothetical protein CIMG_13132 [Coccidioides immitis RS]